MALTLPKVTVIMPVYNAETYLAESVGSLQAQELSDLEIILVDDGSTDSSPALCDRYAAADPRIRVIHKTNSGAGLSRDAALPLVRGRYLAFLDADDRLHPHALACMYAQAERENLDILCAARTEFVSGSTPLHECYDSPLSIISDPSTLRRTALCFIGQPRGEADRALHFEGGLWGKLFRTSMVREAGLHIVSEREYGSEDFIFCYQATLAAKRFGHTADTWLHYRLTPGSISRIMSHDKVERYCHFSQLLEQRLRADGFSYSDSRFAAMSYCLEMTRAFMKYMLLSGAPLNERLAWCRAQCRLPYIRYIIHEYPRKALRTAHRLHLMLMRHRMMRTLLLLTRLQNRR